MPVALAIRATRMRHVGADQPRYRHPYSGAACWLVLSGLTMAMPAFDWGTRANLEYRVAGRFAGLPSTSGIPAILALAVLSRCNHLEWARRRSGRAEQCQQ